MPNLNSTSKDTSTNSRRSLPNYELVDGFRWYGISKQTTNKKNAKMIVVSKQFTYLVYLFSLPI